MIIVECSADVTLVATLTNVSRMNIIHEYRGKGGVCHQLAENYTHSKGLIDEDPQGSHPPYEKNAIPYNKPVAGDIKYLRDESRANDLIVLCPRLEDWILRTAETVGIDVTRHGLPNDANALHRIVNYRLDEFRRLLHLLVRQKADRLLTLRELLLSAHS